MRVSAVLLLLISYAAAFRNYTSSMPMSLDGTTLFWTVSGGTLQIGLKAPSLGWVAVGFATTAMCEGLFLFFSARF